MRKPVCRDAAGGPLLERMDFSKYLYGVDPVSFGGETGG